MCLFYNNDIIDIFNPPSQTCCTVSKLTPCVQYSTIITASRCIATPVSVLCLNVHANRLYIQATCPFFKIYFWYTVRLHQLSHDQLEWCSLDLVGSDDQAGVFTLTIVDLFSAFSPHLAFHAQPLCQKLHHQRRCMETLSCAVNRPELSCRRPNESSAVWFAYKVNV